MKSILVKKYQNDFTQNDFTKSYRFFYALYIRSHPVIFFLFWYTAWTQKTLTGCFVCWFSPLFLHINWYILNKWRGWINKKSQI